MDDYNFPQGSDTPSAPWNQKDIELLPCQTCEGSGKTYWSCCNIDMKDKYPEISRCPECGEAFQPEVCDTCNGTGEETEEHYHERMADGKE